MRHTVIAAAAALAALVAVQVARADTLLTYSFTPASTYTFTDYAGDSYSLSGSFVFDAATSQLQSGSVTETPLAGNPNTGATVFGTVVADSTTEITYSTPSAPTLHNLSFAHSLAIGGSDAITGGSNSQYNATASGAVSTAAVSAAPEPGAWVLMLGGFGFMGLALRSRRRQPKLARATA